MSRPVALKSAASRARVIDHVSGLVIRFGGLGVILAVAAIFFFIGRETLPLFQSASVTAHSESALASTEPYLLAGVDEYEIHAYFLRTNGNLELITLSDWKTATNIPIRQLQSHPVTTAYRSPSRDHLYLGTQDGYLLLAQLKFDAIFTTGKRAITPRLSVDQLIQISKTGSPVTRVFGRHDDNGKAFFAVACADGKIFAGNYEDGEDAAINEVSGSVKAPITALAIDARERLFFAATDAGDLIQWNLEENRENPVASFRPGDGQRHITAMDFLIGNNSLILGFDDGSVEQWFGVRDNVDDAVRKFRRIRDFPPLKGAITCLSPSGRDKSFLAGSANGEVKLIFPTSERVLLDLDTGTSVEKLCYAQKLTGIMALSGANGGKQRRASYWHIYNPHPEISWKTLFGKVWYESYDQPQYVWQSTGGSDDFESKFSLVPLIVGTLKGAFYGLLFAIPISVLAAIYTSQFMSLRLKTFVKPTVEIMAALPSVVIGFLAGLWLAPMLERRMVAVFLAFLIIPTLIWFTVVTWHRLPRQQRARLPAGMELGAILPVVMLGFWLALQLGPILEPVLFKSGFKQWVFEAFGQQFEQRNSLVIGFAMAFAVIPIIFTISEDALSSVPPHYASGSLALGASRWQTAIRVIVPSASPGIFSAIMIGFGRAVGETMIVLMATGNTPILSLSPFNGMRTLSANIAVEIPEAPVGGTLYRVLFLTAALLFVLTFIVNTAAEIVRQRLREKYQTM